MAILATSLAAIFGAAYALTADMPWPDAVYAGSQQGMGALVLLFLAVVATLLLCIPVLPIVIIGVDVLHRDRGRDTGRAQRPPWICLMRD